MYEITVSGRLPADWSEWFDGFTIETFETKEGPVDRLTGPVADQSALHGLIARVRDLGLPLLSIREVTPEELHPRNTPLGT